MFKKVVSIVSMLLYMFALMQLSISALTFGMQPVTFFAIIVFLVSVLLWIFVSTEWPSLLAIVSIGLVLGMNQAGQLSFGNSTFVFLLFTFVVTYALNQTAFLKRVTRWLLHTRLAQKSMFGFLVSFLAVVLLLSSFLSPTVTYMFLFPLFEEIAQQCGWKKGDKVASYVLIAMFTTISIGTAMTPINHVFAITAMSIYQTATQQVISATAYMMMAIPAGLVLFFVLLIGLKLRLKEQSHITLQLASLSDLPKADKREKVIVGLFFSMIALWLAPEVLGGIMPEVAKFLSKQGIVFPPLLFTIIMTAVHVSGKPLVDLSQAFTKGVHWPSMLLVGATLSLGSFISSEKIGVVAMLQNGMGPVLSHLPGILLIVIFIAWTTVQTNVTSNLVTVSLVTTVLVSLSLPGVQVGVLSALVGFSSSIAVMTAPAMPYVAISIGSKWTTTQDCLRVGSMIVLLTIIVASAVAYPIGLLVF